MSEEGRNSITATLRRIFMPQWSRLGWSIPMNRWADKLGWLPVYRCSVWIGGSIRANHFIAMSPPAELMTGPRPIGSWSMGKDEFENGECKGNRWLVPTNRGLDLSRD